MTPKDTPAPHPSGFGNGGIDVASVPSGTTDQTKEDKN